MNVTKENFDKEVLQSEIPVLVSFTAPWCPPCKLAVPVLEDISAVGEGKWKVVKINIDEEKELTAEHNIASIPTFFYFFQGKKVASHLGLMNKQDMINQLIRCMNNN